MNKKIIIGSSLAALVIGGLVPVAMSLPANAYNGNGSNSLIDQLTSKFNLNKNEVQAVFDANHTERQAEMQSNKKDRLAIAVTDGKITQAQADLITAKLAEMQTERQANHLIMSEKTQTERREFMETKRTEFETWAKENGIDPTLIQMGGKGQYRGMKMGNRQ